MSPWENSLWGEWWQKNFLFHFLTSLVGSLHTWAELALCQSPPCLISSHQPLCVSTAVMWNCLKPSLSHGFGLSPWSLACFSSKPCNAISLSAISISQGNKRKFCVPFSYCSYCSLRTKLVELMEFQLSYSNPERWCCESATLNMPANLENSAVPTGLEKVSFHSNPKERQCQRMLRLPHNCTHLTR